MEKRAKATLTIFIFSLLAPVAIAAIYISVSDLGINLSLLSFGYAVYFIILMKIFHPYFKYWLELGLENKALLASLNAEKLVSEQRLYDLTEEIEEHWKTEAEGEKHRAMLSNLLGNLPGMAYRAVNDGNWTLEFISDGCQAILGLTQQQLSIQGKLCISEVLVSDDRRLNLELFRAKGEGDAFQHEYKLITPLGEEKRVVERGCRVFDNNGNLVAIDGFITDVSEQFRLSNELARLERHDSLTGVYNRAQFEAIVQNVMYKASASSIEHSLLFFDLDQFQIINDTCGHATGDELLRQVSAILQNRLRRQDTLARLGGDEFGILLENCSAETATQISMELCRSIEDFRFDLKDRKISLTASIGIAATTHGLTTLEQMLSAAEAAAYTAKEFGRNRAHLYHRNDVALLRRNRYKQWAIEIPEALNEGRMHLVWQKIVPVSKDAPEQHWYEVLIRMRDRKGETIMPSAFLPAAERYNLAVLIDTWVVKTLLSKLDLASDKFDELGLCFINISGQSISQPVFLENIYELVTRSGISPSRLCFEITETAAIASKQQAIAMMDKLKQLGCRFALDDFGSGLSSFDYLRDFPVDFLKIDGSFVKGMKEDPINHSIVTSINDIGHASGKQIIAEYVETDDLLQLVREVGVDYAQGYSISCPSPLPESLRNRRTKCI